jgi:2-isopropylmalate synthase
MSLSPYNDGLDSSSASSSVKVRELTLRQLGHMEADLTLEEKLFWLGRLADAGVAEAIVWGVDSDAALLIDRAREAGIKIDVGLYGKIYFPKEMRAIMETARDCRAAFVCLNGRGPDFALEEMGWTGQQMIDASVDSVKLAKDYGQVISIGLAYTTQADWTFIEEFSGAVAAAGADRLYCPDSMGVASPHGMRKLVSGLRRVVDIPIEAHCHNDFGLAVANSVACVEGGAQFVEVFVNGMDPERSGITSLEEVAVSLEMLYGVHTGIKLDQLTSLSRLHQDMTGMRIADNKPVVGPRAFNYRVAAGRAASAPKRDVFYGSPKVVPFNPAEVGNSRVFMIGKFSGPDEVAKRLEDIGLSISDEQLATVLDLVRDRGRATKRAVTDDDLRYFVEVAAATQRPSPVAT